MEISMMVVEMVVQTERWRLASVMALWADLQFLSPRRVQRIRGTPIEDETALSPDDGRQQVVLLYANHRIYWAALVGRRRVQVKFPIFEWMM